jgi:hypothetical protein
VADRDRDPLIPGGGLTGETGDLTAGEDEPFIPAERREVTDPELEGAMTLHQRREAEIRQATETPEMGPGAAGSASGELQTERASGLTGLQGQASMGFSATPPVGTAAGAGATELAQRGSGYGSSHGLAEDDPAYRMETRPQPEGDAQDRPRAGRDEVEPGVDEFSTPEGEHL